jgi:hypothetical protein
VAFLWLLAVPIFVLIAGFFAAAISAALALLAAASCSCGFLVAISAALPAVAAPAGGPAGGSAAAEHKKQQQQGQLQDSSDTDMRAGEQWQRQGTEQQHAEHISRNMPGKQLLSML